MNDIGKTLVGVGVVLVLVGAFLWLGGRVPWFGRLPGDLRVEREHFRFYFPVVTCLIISAVLTLLFWLLGKR